MWNKARTHSNLISSEQLLPSLLLCAFSKQHTTADARLSAEEWQPHCNGSLAARHQG